MYGFIIATAKLGLKQTLVKSLVVSTTTTDKREGWQFVDKLPDNHVCDLPDKTNNLPVILHYCKRYMLGRFFFSKYRLKKQYITCSQPLLTPPEKDSATRYTYAERPPPDRGASHDMFVKNVTKKEAKREAFMLCGMIDAVNSASKYYKSQYCGGRDTVFDETYNFFDDPYST